MPVTISDKAQAIQALLKELDIVEIKQLALAEEMGRLAERQHDLALKSLGLNTAIAKILEERT